MPVHRHLPKLIAALLLTSSLGGCGTINGWLSVGFEDYIPAWAGGLPSDAPPRPGTAKYDEFQRQREQQRLEPAAKTAGDAAAKPAIDPIH
jgi:hypothetical protein